MAKGVPGSVGRLAAACVVALALAGCQRPDDPSAATRGKMSAQELHPLKLERKPVSLAVELTGDIDALSPLHKARIDDFIAQYRAGGQAPLRIVVGGSAKNRDAAMRPARLLRRYAEAQGVDPNDINIYFELAGDEAQGLSVMSFDRLAVRLPECGDWSTSGSRDPDNGVHPNFGCATQRYIGQMVADPADLVRARPAGLSDTARSNAVIQKYRIGESTVREVRPEEIQIQTQSTQGQ